jgi:hypothetical protein
MQRDTGPLNCLAQLILAGRQVDADGRNPGMFQHGLHHMKLPAFISAEIQKGGDIGWEVGMHMCCAF